VRWTFFNFHTWVQNLFLFTTVQKLSCEWFGSGLVHVDYTMSIGWCIIWRLEPGVRKTDERLSLIQTLSVIQAVAECCSVHVASLSVNSDTGTAVPASDSEWQIIRPHRMFSQLELMTQPWRTDVYTSLHSPPEKYQIMS